MSLGYHEPRYRRAPTQGFTLVEVLVATLVFATVTAVGYAGLQRLLDYREALLEQRRQVAALERLNSLLQIDLASILGEWTSAPPKSLTLRHVDVGTSERRLSLRRHGSASSPEALQRAGRDVEFAFSQEGTTRSERPAFRLVSDDAARQVLELDVGVSRVRIIDDAGGQHEFWPPPTPDRWPVAVSVEVIVKPEQSLQWMFALGPQAPSNWRQ